MSPCCDYHAAQDICLQCRQTIADDETRYYGQRLMAKQTFFGPAEYEWGGPFCSHCWDAQQQDCDEHLILRGSSTQELADQF